MAFLNIKRSAKTFNVLCAKVSANILKKRIQSGKTQKEFAKYMGVSQGMVSKWESGNYNFTIKAIAEIFDKLNISCKFDVISDSAKAYKPIPIIKYENAKFVFNKNENLSYYEKNDNLEVKAG